MKIIVTVKHVPETGAVVLDEETGTMKREGVESIPNPLDLYGVEVALKLRERYGGTITAVSMGPAGAERSLREVIAMGCDDAVLITGREFAGSDTLATSRALARAVESLGGCDLLIFGERATDGDTGQVGPGTAALLDYPLAAYVSAVEAVEPADAVTESSEADRPSPLQPATPGIPPGSAPTEGAPASSDPARRRKQRSGRPGGTRPRAIVERLTEEGYERLSLALPAALTVIKEVATPRLPTLRGKQRARSANVGRLSGLDLGLEPQQTGLGGSPTRVERIFHPKIAREGELLRAGDERRLDVAAERLADFILSRLPALAADSAQTVRHENSGAQSGSVSLGLHGASSAPSAAAATPARGRAGGPASPVSPHGPSGGSNEGVLAKAGRNAGDQPIPTAATDTGRCAATDSAGRGGVPPETWVVAEDRGGRASEITWELLGRGRPLADKLGGPLSVVLMGGDSTPVDLEELFARGADRIYLVNDPSLVRFVVEVRRRVLERLVRERRPAAVIAAATTSGRSLMPQLAVRLGTGLTADCTELDIDVATGALLQTRPAIGGNIMATIRTRNASPSMATVRPHSAPPARRSRTGDGEVVAVELLRQDGEERVQHLSHRAIPDAAVALQDAQVVVSCGRGFRKRENLSAVAELARLLGATIGASREAVDRGWIGYPHQVGLSGKTISPELYIAIGISGAVQHLAGIKTAKTIVAINNDPEAPIFRIADFGVVGDLFELVPLLTEKLRSRVVASTSEEGR